MAPWYIQPLYDNAMVPGPRQRRFAGMLGFSNAAIIEPLLSCDVAKFANVAGTGVAADARSFLFVGRLVEEKGIEPLIAAYRAYRAKVSEPWGLLVAGTGPLSEVLNGVDGIDQRGFVQPSELPALFGEALCFVLPSRFEPWGVALHEAVCAGLPVICSTACGASDQFVVAGENGFVFKSGDVAALTDAMVRITELPHATLGSFGRRSHALSQKVSPKLWADALWQTMKDFKPGR
jgi:glycosyltransferase involved in cell wall biosynthesis